MCCSQGIIVFDWISLCSFGKVVIANNGLIKIANLWKKYIDQHIFTLLLLEKLERCVVHFTLKLESFFVFKYAATLLNILYQKKRASFFSYVDVLLRCEGSPVPWWIHLLHVFYHNNFAYFTQERTVFKYDSFIWTS